MGVLHLEVKELVPLSPVRMSVSAGSVHSLDISTWVLCICGAVANKRGVCV